MKRPKKLLFKASEAFQNGTDPFSQEWLMENNVTADECMDLSKNIGTAIRIFLQMSPRDIVRYMEYIFLEEIDKKD